MLIEQCAYSNRWRQVTPAAKGLFALCGLLAVFLAPTPRAAAGVAVLLAVVTLLGARVAPVAYLRVAAPALLFLAVSTVTLLVSLRLDAAAGITLVPLPEALPQAARVGARSLGGLAALLFLVLTTPLYDIIALLRRLRVPEVLLDLMILCHRMLFVLSEAVHDMQTAQAARLGHARPRRRLRSLGILAANLAVQVWQRSRALHYGALSRNNDGPLRFLEREYPHAGRSLVTAALGGCCLLLLTRVAI